jgi:peptidoglycan/LPS O-acetylase OafA/YrhL
MEPPSPSASLTVNTAASILVPDSNSPNAILKAVPAAVSEQSYIPQLDSLRAIALGLVIITHWMGNFPPTGSWWVDLPLISCRIGWIGVDLFFVISGFLITGILIDTRQAPGYFRNFYARRALRIMPLYYVVLTLIACAAPTIAILAPLKLGHAYIGDLKWHYAFLTNISEGMGLSKSRAIGVFWSLAVEEHFYLIWPLIVYQYHANLLKLCIGGIVASCLLRIVLLFGMDANEHLIGYLTPCRIDSLLAGSLVAVLARQGQHTVNAMVRWAKILAPVGLFAIIMCLGFQEIQSRFKNYTGGQHPWVVAVGYTYFAMFFASLLVLAVFGGLAPKLFVWSPARNFGKITYCSYLIHEPVHMTIAGVALLSGLVGAQFSGRWLLVNALSFVAVVILATASWHFFEKPILYLKTHFSAGKSPL